MFLQDRTLVYFSLIPNDKYFLIFLKIENLA
jgi:hypothetical protein